MFIIANLVTLKKCYIFLSDDLFYLNSVDSDEMLHYAVFHLGLYCKSTRLGVSCIERVKQILWLLSLFVFVALSPMSTAMVIHTFFLGRLEQAVYQYFMHIPLLVNDNNPSWMIQRKGGEWPSKLFHDQSPWKYGTGPGSNSRPLDLMAFKYQ